MSTTMYIRNVPPHIAARIHRAANSRQMHLAEYVTALSKLHDAMREHADAGDQDIQAELETLSLQTVKT